jgi:hypothetical protein
LTKIILNVKYLFIYNRSKLKLVIGQLARDEIPLDTSSAPFSPILFPLKIKKKKFKNQIIIIKNNFQVKIKK